MNDFNGMDHWTIKERGFGRSCNLFNERIVVKNAELPKIIMLFTYTLLPILSLVNCT